MAGTQQSQNSSFSNATSSGGSYFPYDVGGLYNSLANVAQGAAGQYNNFLANPTASPLFQNQLGPLMASLAPYEQQARQAQTDAFRSAGGLRSGAYGVAVPRLEGELASRRYQAAGNLLGQVFGQMTQALQSPMNQIAPLLNALKLTQQSSQSNSQSQGSSSGQSTDPVQQGSQGSGLTARDLLSALASMGSTNGMAAPTPASMGNYNTPLSGNVVGGYDNGLVGYGQGYDQYGNPDTGLSSYPTYSYQDLYDPNAGYAEY